MRLSVALAPVMLLLGGALAGCSAYRDPGAEFLVETEPPGAACYLERQGAPLAEINPTPAIALVPRSNADIAMTCRRPGFRDTPVVIHAFEAPTGIFWGGSRWDYAPVRVKLLR